MLGRKEKPKTFRKLTFWGAGIAGAMYFFDPQMGRTRRARFGDQVRAALRRKARDAQQKTDYAAKQAYGSVRSTVAADTPPTSDETLKEKIESEVLRGDDFPKGRINLEVVGGIVTLRGELDDRSRIEELEQEVRKVSGVLEVENLMHLPGEVAPNKADALKASRRANR